MPYAGGKQPMVGDNVRNNRNGSEGVVRRVSSGQDQITVEWKNGTSGTCSADECSLLSR
jgi:hypothetical protein